MRSSGDGEFSRWGVHGMGSLGDGEFTGWGILGDGEFTRWGLQQIGSSGVKLQGSNPGSLAKQKHKTRKTLRSSV